MSRKLDDELLWLLEANVQLFTLERPNLNKDKFAQALNDNVDLSIKNTSRQDRTAMLDMLKNDSAFGAFSQLCSKTTKAC